MSVTITVDGRSLEVREGARLIDACAEHGIDIPHYCYHPGLGPDGNCRMCQVEFVTERGNRMGISCKTIVADGMVVNVQSETARAARASVEEFLLLNHPLDCPICDKAGECTLQDYYMEHDLQDSRQTFTRFKKQKAVDIGPTLILDQERCVLCDRCVRFLKDIAQEPQLYIAGRGHSAYITTFPGENVTSPYSLNTVDLCPVGALTAKDFRFSSPSWFLKNTNSVCTTCARGCSMQIQTRDGNVRRIRPRPNPDVNGYWSCDEGRLNYKYVNEHRIVRAQVRRGDIMLDASPDEAVLHARKLLGYAAAGKVDSAAPNGVLILMSAHCTLEEMYLLKAVGVRTGARALVARHCADGVDDSLLRRADRHPNARGAELLGLDVVDLQGPDGMGAAAPLRDTASQGVLIAAGFNKEIPDAVGLLVDGAHTVMAICGCDNRVTDASDLVMPGVTFAEKDGLVVNFEGHLQRLRPALRDYGENDWVVIERLLASLDGRAPREMIGSVREAISAEVDAFTGVDLVHTGPLGIRLSAQPVG